MPIDLTQLPPDEQEENIVHKALYTPIVKMLGLKPALDKATAPTLKDAEEQKSVPEDEGLLHLGYRLLTGKGTSAEYKGAAAGATEAVNPALVAQAASLGSGPLAAIANGAVALQGATDAADSSLPTWKRVAGGVGALTGAAGTAAGVMRAAKGVKAASAAGDISNISKVAGSSNLMDQAAALKKDMADGYKLTDDFLKENYPDLYNEVVKNPGGKIATEHVYGPKGRPPTPTASEISTTAAADRAANISNTDKRFRNAIKQKYSDMDATARAIEKEGTQATRNDKARDKFITGELVQDTRNQKARDKFITGELVQDTRNLKARNKAQDEIISEASALKQQEAIDAFKNRGDVKPGNPSLTEINRGEGDNRAQQTLRTSFNVEPPPKPGGVPTDIDLLGEAGAGGRPSPNAPTEGGGGAMSDAELKDKIMKSTGRYKTFGNFAKAQTIAEATGGKVRQVGPRNYRIEWPEEEAQFGSMAGETPDVLTQEPETPSAPANPTRYSIGETSGGPTEPTGPDNSLYARAKRAGVNYSEYLDVSPSRGATRTPEQHARFLELHNRINDPSTLAENWVPPEVTPKDFRPDLKDRWDDLVEASGTRDLTPSEQDELESIASEAKKSGVDPWNDWERHDNIMSDVVDDDVSKMEDQLKNEEVTDLNNQFSQPSPKAARIAEAATPDLVNEDPLAPSGKTLTPEGIQPNGAHPSRGTLPAEPEAPVPTPKKVRGRKAKSAIESVASTVAAASEPELTPEEFSQILGRTAAENPIAEVPFSLDRGKAPQSPAPQEGNLLGGEEPPPAPTTANLKPKPKGPSGGASVPFMITNEMKSRLRALGVTPAQYNKMTPQEAWDRLNTAASSTGPTAPLLAPEVMETTEQGNAAQALDQARKAGPKLRKKSVAPIAPAQAPEVPATPITSGLRVGPNGEVTGIQTPLEVAGPHYQQTQAAFKAGEVPKEGARIAGRAASRLNRENAGVAPIVSAPAQNSISDIAAQIESVRKDLADPATDEATKAMLQKWLADNDPSVKGLASNPVDPSITDYYTKGILPGQRGAAAINPIVRMGLGLGGAVAGGATDPLGNRPASIAAGAALGFGGPELGAAVSDLGIPTIAKAASAAAPYTEKGLDFVNRLHNSGLLSPLSVAKKAAGDIGGLTLAAIEHPDRAGNILRQFTSPEGRALLAQNFREGYATQNQEALSGLENFFQGNRPGITGIPGKIMSASGKTMGGLTKATKGILGESGFSKPEQEYYTLTAYPTHIPTKNLYNALRYSKRFNPESGQVEEQGSRILAHLSPFARIGVNRLERGWEYSPFGLLNSKIKDTEEAKKIATKALLGFGAGLGAYKLTPEDFAKEHPIAASTVASLGGPLGLPLLTGMALKGSKDSSDVVDWAKNMANTSQTIGRDIPGLRLLEDITGRSFPKGFARNYFSGYTNFLRPLAIMQNPEQPDVSSPDLPLSGQIFNQMLSNVPILRGALPRK